MIRAVAVPVLPAVAADTVAVPAPIARARPAESILSTVVSLLAQVMVRPVIAFPALSRTDALNWMLFPTVSVGAAGVRPIDDTAAAMVAVAMLESGPNVA